MKKLLPFLLIVILLASAQTAFGSVLVFKLSKQVDSDKSFDLATVATGKYAKVRIAVKYDDGKPKEVTPKEKISDKFDASPLDELAKLELSDDFNFVQCFGVEGSELFNIGGCGLIDVPPSKILIRVKGAGKYTVAVWAN